jgi:hypothetical protein
MNQQDMQVTKRTTYRPATHMQHDPEEDEYDDVYPPRMPTSARRYTTIPAQPRKRVINVYDMPAGIPPRRSRTVTQNYAVPALPTGQSVQHLTTAQQPRRGHFHWMLLVGMGMLAMLALWVLGQMLVSWWNTTQDDLHYGRPRTFQIDERVGHNDTNTPSHFIALNLNSHVIIIEFPGGDPTRAKVYLGPTLLGDDQDFTPVTLSFKDVNGDGKPDMLVHLQDQTVVFINDGGQFRPQKPGERVNL